jgi:hypothetical protein
LIRFLNKCVNGETSKHLLSLIAVLSIEPVFGLEFVQLGGLRSILSLIKIPHINIIQSACKILEHLAALDLIPGGPFSKISKQELIETLGKLINAKVVKSEKKKPVIKVVRKIPTVPGVKLEDSQGQTLAQVEERKRLAEEEALLRKRDAMEAKKLALAKSKMKDKVKVKTTTTKKVNKVVEHVAPRRSIPFAVSVEMLAEKSFTLNLDEDVKPHDQEAIFHTLLSSLIEAESSDDKAAVLEVLGKTIIQTTVPEIICELICKSIVGLFQEPSLNLISQCLTISFYLMNYEGHHHTLYNSGLIHELVLILDGYNLTAIGFALQCLDRYCCSPVNATHLVEEDIINKVNVVVTSGIGKIRIHSQNILWKLAKFGSSSLEVIEQLQGLNFKNPWIRVAATWGLPEPWTMQIPSQAV